MNTPPSFTWLYYKVLLGEYAWAFDHLIAKLSEILEEPDLQTWFFIRYIDEDGIHMRLRLGVAGGAARNFDRAVYPRLHAMTAELGLVPRQDPRRLVNLGARSGMPAMEKFPLGVKRAEYRPEVDIYGGDYGVRIAEDVFAVSSRIAQEVIRDEADAQLSRKDLAPAFMLAALEEFPFDQPVSEFLDQYIDYWTASSPTFGSYVLTFEDKSLELIEERRCIVRGDADYGEAGRHLGDWRQALRRAAVSYSQMTGSSAVLLRRVLFYFVHLMNNRLGFTTLEEVYLAVLLKAWVSRNRSFFGGNLPDTAAR